MLIDDYLRILHLDRRMPLNFDLGPLHIHLHARSVFFMWVTVVILVVAGAAVLASRRRELIQKWITWVLIAPVVGIPIWIGRGTTAMLAAALAVVAVMEYSRLVRLSRLDTSLLLALAVLYPFAAWLRPSLLGLAPIVVLACALPSVFSGDVEHGGRPTTFTAFGSVWICWSLAHLVTLWADAFLVCFAAAATDVAACCGGKGLRRFGWTRRPLSPLSSNKTIGGLVGAVIGAFLVLTLLGTISVGLLIAVAFVHRVGVVYRHRRARGSGRRLRRLHTMEDPARQRRHVAQVLSSQADHGESRTPSHSTETVHHATATPMIAAMGPDMPRTVNASMCLAPRHDP